MKDFLIVGEIWPLVNGATKTNQMWFHIISSSSERLIPCFEVKRFLILKLVKMPKRNFIEDEGFGAEILFLSLQNPDPFQK